MERFRNSTDSTFLVGSHLTTTIHWPWYCIVYIRVAIKHCDSVWPILLFVYICFSVGNPVFQRGRVWIQFTDLTPPHFCACPVPTPYVVLLWVSVCVFNNVRWEDVVVRFVHLHWLNIVFIMQSNQKLKS